MTIFWAPGEAFAALGDHPGVLGSIGLALAAQLSIYCVYYLRADPNFGWIRLLSFLGYVVTTLVATVLFAGFVSLTLLLFGKSANYRRTLSVVALAYWAYWAVRAAGSLVVLVLTRDALTTNPRDVFHTDLSVLAPAGASPVVAWLLSSADVLYLAFLAVVAYGLSIVIPRLSPKSAAMAVLLVWGVYFVAILGVKIAVS